MNASGKPGERQRLAALWRHVLVLVGPTARHGLPQLSASLTYYTVLSLFPALFVVVSLLGVIGIPQDTLDVVLDAVGERTDSQWVVDLVSGVLDDIFASSSSGVFLSISLLASLWTASGYVRSFMWSSNAIYEVSARRTYLHGLRARLGLAMLLLVVFATAVAILTFAGPLGGLVANALGLDGSDFSALSRLTLPALFCTAVLMVALLYKYAPARCQPALLRLLPGSALAVISWIAASIGFSFYLANFGSYNEVYGTLGAAVAALVWVWILNMALLAGVEVNRALECRREAGASAPTAE